MKAEDGDGHTGFSNPFNVVSVTAPAVSKPKLLSQGQFQFTITGDSGCNYQVLVSADLKSWQPLCSVAMTNSTCDIRDASSQQQRFYRAQWVP